MRAGAEWHRVAVAVMVAALTAACSEALPSFGGTDCGSEANEPNTQARRCLLRSFDAGAPATLVSHLTSVEGDPITRIYAVLGPGQLEIVHDARQDAFGSGKIEYLRCDRLVPVDEWNLTRTFPDIIPARFVFVEDGCRDATN